MIGFPRNVRVYVHRSAVDMRKAYDSLGALVVSEFGRDILAGDVFVFVGKDRRRAKALYWDGTGMCLFAKRLSKGRFIAPWERPGDAPLTMTLSELSLLFEGSEHVGRIALSPTEWIPPAVVSLGLTSPI